MESNFVELNITYQSVSKLIIYEHGQTLGTFLKEIKQVFNIDLEIKLQDGNADITSVKSFYKGRKLFVETLALLPLPDPPIENLEPSASTTKSVIDFSGIAENEYTSKNLLNQANEWANGNKFNLMSTGGVKPFAAGVFRTLICSQKNCPYKLTFKAKSDDSNYKLDKNLAQKNNSHSKKFFYLVSFL